jgi:hypothetical protein
MKIGKTFNFLKPSWPYSPPRSPLPRFLFLPCFSSLAAAWPISLAQHQASCWPESDSPLTQSPNPGLHPGITRSNWPCPSRPSCLARTRCPSSPLLCASCRTQVRIVLALRRATSKIPLPSPHGSIEEGSRFYPQTKLIL